MHYISIIGVSLGGAFLGSAFFVGLNLGSGWLGAAFGGIIGLVTAFLDERQQRARNIRVKVTRLNCGDFVVTFNHDGREIRFRDPDRQACLREVTYMTNCSQDEIIIEEVSKMEEWK